MSLKFTISDYIESRLWLFFCVRHVLKMAIRKKKGLCFIAHGIAWEWCDHTDCGWDRMEKRFGAIPYYNT